MRADRPSSTATLIAAATLFLARDARMSHAVPAGAPPWCAACLRAVSPLALALVQAVSHPALRWAARLAERATIPGLLLHFMLRKRWIEQAVRGALAGGCSQAVIVGAGFDTLALRLAPEFPEVLFVEIDHPATQRVKRAAVLESGFQARNLELVAADLAHRGLEDALAGSGFRPGERSVFVLEGLLMYLADLEIAAIFGALGTLQSSGGRVVFTVMEPANDGRSRFHNATALVTGLLSLWQEPFKSALARGEAPQFLARFGYRMKDLAAAEHLESKGLPLAEGEILVLAER